MAEQITVFELLRAYKGWVMKGNIQFLKEQKDRDEIIKYLDPLLDIFRTATKSLKASSQVKTLSEVLEPETYKIHMYGRDLWKALASAALNDIGKEQKTSRGNSKLFKFLEEATRFEDLLYGLEDYYRDHTLHSLWVYFIGEYLLRKKLNESMGKSLNWHLYNDIGEHRRRYSYPRDLIVHAEAKERDIIKKVDENRDAIWCIIALCHDLGYSLAKLRELNKRIKNVLDFFDIPDYQNVGYSLDIEHQYLMTQFLELMSMDIRIVPSDDYREYFDQIQEAEDQKQRENLSRLKELRKIPMNDLKKTQKTEMERLERKNQNIAKKNEVLKRLEELEKKDFEALTRDESMEIEQLNSQYYKVAKIISGQNKEIEEKLLVKCYRDDSTYWRLCRSLEKKQHGILSAFLLYKVLGIFAEASIVGPSESWGLEDDEAIENIIRGEILFAIAQHTFDFTDSEELNSLADLLVISDELEEFSRLGRQTRTRRYSDTTADAQISFSFDDKKKFAHEIGITITYEVAPPLVKDKSRLIKFFQHKASQLCAIYSLGQKKERERDYKLYKINQVKMIVDGGGQDAIELWIQLSTIPGETKGKLPPKKTLDSGYIGPITKFEEYPVKCHNDEIEILYGDQEVTLDNWFKEFHKKEQII